MSICRLDAGIVATAIRIFGFKLLIVTAVSARLADHRGLPISQMLALFCAWHATFGALPALFRRQKFVAVLLTATK